MRRSVPRVSITFFLFLPLTMPLALRAEPTRAELEQKRAAVERNNHGLKKEFVHQWTTAAFT